MPKKGKTPQQRPTIKNQPLKRFFSQYPEFQYQPENSPIVEFKWLCEEYGWGKESKKRKAARHEFNIAMTEEFNSLYGSDEKDINNWYKLCHVLKIDPLPNTLKECRAAVSRVHVNLVDLVGGFRENMRIFQSVEELADYTLDNDKIFPKKSARDGGVLRALRRHISSPWRDIESRSTQGQQSQPRNSHHSHPVENVPLEGSYPFQGARGCALGPALPYHALLATCLQVQLARRYAALMLQSSYPPPLLTSSQLQYHVPQPGISRYQVTWPHASSDRSDTNLTINSTSDQLS